MMEIHCKDCGGKEFARKEEMYICTSCGREYSAFEVIELTDDVISDQKTFESKRAPSGQRQSFDDDGGRR